MEWRVKYVSKVLVRMTNKVIIVPFRRNQFVI